MDESEITSDCSGDGTEELASDLSGLDEQSPSDEHTLLPQHSSSPSFPYQSAIVYYVFYLLGMGTLLPWNFFITADAYWNYKYRNTSIVNVSHTADVTTNLQYNFFGYLSVTSMVPNTIFLMVSAALAHRVSQYRMLVSSLCLVVLMFVVTTALVPVDSDDWQHAFFAVTLVIVAVMNAGSAVLQSSLFGLAARFPGPFVSAVMSGQALGAVFASLARIVSVATTAAPPATPGSHGNGSTGGAWTAAHGFHDNESVGVSSTAVGGAYPSAVSSALVYFLLADCTLVISLLSYFYISTLDFYKLHTAKTPSGTVTPISDREVNGNEGAAPRRAGGKVLVVDDASGLMAVAAAASEKLRAPVTVRSVLGKIKYYAISVGLIFAVTLAVFPAVTNKIIPLRAPNSSWSRDYFVPVCCYLLFNACDYLGRIAAGYTVWPRRHQSSWLLVLTSLRVAFVPLLMFCNVDHKQLYTVFAADEYYIVFIALMGLSNGYLATLCMIYGPMMVEPEEQHLASSIMAAALGIGLCAGALTSTVVISLL